MFDIPVNEVHSFSDWSELANIKFEFEIVEGKKFDKRVCSNPMCFDTESSSGYLDLSNGKVHNYDKVKYDEATSYTKVFSNNKIKYYHDNEEITQEEYIAGAAYKLLIDSLMPVSCTYIWMLAIGDINGVKVFSGRTWEEWNRFYKLLTMYIYMRLDHSKDDFLDKIMLEDMEEENYPVKPYNKADLIIYVHNLGFDFQFMRNSDMRFYVKSGRKNVFARKQRKPMKAKATSKYANIIFKDSYMIAQRSLAKWADDENCPVKKLVGDLDYLLIRNPATPISYEELQYCINDVVSVVHLINALIHKFKSIMNIPLTQTGIVRRECVAKSSPEWKAQQSSVMQEMTKDLYDKLVDIFAGGWTHANAHKANKIYRYVRCFDFASSYPWVMVSQKFPVESFRKKDISEWSNYEDIDPTSLDVEERYFIKVTVRNFKTALENTFWSSSKTDVLQGEHLDNGKIERAELLTTYITDLDWIIFRQAYEDVKGGKLDYTVEELYVAKAGFLDRGLILTILDYYTKKTSYKGVAGKESLYANSKTYINGIYGCSVTNFLTDGCIFTPEEWQVKKMYTKEEGEKLVKEGVIDSFVDFEQEKQKIYTPESTFLSFQIGPYITAHARYNLWSLILKLDKHVIYGDTDSLKGIFDAADIAIIDEYNKNVRLRQEEVARRLNFDVNLYRPKKPNGERVCLGNFDEEEMCLEFKTLGAKRYVVKYEDEKTGELKIKCTIAGLPKKSGAKIIKDIDKDFNDNTTWNTTQSDKKTATYADNLPEVNWVDYLGNEYKINDRYGVVITPTTFNLTLSKDYRGYLERLAERQNIEYKK